MSPKTIYRTWRVSLDGQKTLISQTDPSGIPVPMIDRPISN